MSNERDKRYPTDELERQLRQLLMPIEGAPVSDEMRLTAQKLQLALNARKRFSSRN